MQAAISDKQRRHRVATSKAMKRLVHHCPKCERGQHPIKFELTGLGHIGWACRYCGHEWTASPGAVIGHENRERVRSYFAEHIGCTNVECAKALGLSVMAVGRHVAKLRAEWIAES